MFDKIDYVYFILKINLYFTIGNRQPKEPALRRLYRHIFVPYSRREFGSSVRLVRVKLLLNFNCYRVAEPQT